MYSKENDLVSEKAKLQELQARISQLELELKQKSLENRSFSSEKVIEIINHPNDNLEYLKQKISTLQECMSLEIINKETKNAIVSKLKHRIGSDFENFNYNSKYYDYIWKVLYLSALLLGKWNAMTAVAVEIILIQLSMHAVPSIDKDWEDSALQYIKTLNLAPFIPVLRFSAKSYLLENSDLLSATPLNSIIDEVLKCGDYIPYYPFIENVLSREKITYFETKTEAGKNILNIYHQDKLHSYLTDQCHSFFLKFIFSLETQESKNEEKTEGTHDLLDWLHTEIIGLETKNLILDEIGQDKEREILFLREAAKSRFKMLNKTEKSDFFKNTSVPKGLKTAFTDENKSYEL